MPADSEQVVLPRTWRPLGVTLAVLFFGLMFLLVAGFAWYAMDPESRARFTDLQKWTMLALLVAAGWGTWVLGRCRVTAAEEGVTVVNGLRTDTYAWDEIAAFVLEPGMPWARLSLRGGQVRQMIGLQSSDGLRTERAVAVLRQLLRERGL